MEVSRIYFDMDGVLADFTRGFEDMCGLKPPVPGTFAPDEDAWMWAMIRETDHYYDRLDLCPGAKEMFDAVYGKYGDRCEILTGIPQPDKGIVTAAEDKLKWMKRMLSGKVKVNICYRAQKIRRCKGKDCILIDDQEKNIREWERAGGTGILHVSAEQTMEELKKLGLL